MVNSAFPPMPEFPVSILTPLVTVYQARRSRNRRRTICLMFAFHRGRAPDLRRAGAPRHPIHSRKRRWLLVGWWSDWRDLMRRKSFTQGCWSV